MIKESKIIFAANYISALSGGTFTITNNILFLENDKDEFYCNLRYRTEHNKFRFWHKYKGQEEYHRQLDTKNIIAGMYRCFWHKNKYLGLPYYRQDRINTQKEINNAWKEIR